MKRVLFTVQKALLIFVDGGSIILNSSVASTKGFLKTTVYATTKAAVPSFARCWTVDLKERRIRINTLCPSPVDTHIFDNIDNDEEGKKKLEAILKAQTVYGRIGTPEETARAAVFLGSSLTVLSIN